MTYSVHHYLALAAAAAALACNVSPPSGLPSTMGAGDATGEPEAGTTGTTTGLETSSTGDDDDSALPLRYDLSIPDAPPPPAGSCTEGEEPLSHIWIANSVENTISKINTVTVVEEGRYETHAANGDPSRTSVNLNGNVAVANRNGGIAKFWANPEHCVDSNGQPGIQTSFGADDVLPFGEDDCMAWSTPLDCHTNRPAAWTRGVLNPWTCRYEDVDFWTVCDDDVLLLDGQSGDIKETVSLGTNNSWAYGGAADANGNFWIIDFGFVDAGGPNALWGTLVRVDYETLEVTHYDMPNSGAYGITVDGEGRPFVCSSTVARFNLDDATWDEAPEPSGGGGCMYDGQGRVWHGGGGGWLYGFDTETLELEAELSVPQYTHGVSIDAAGYIWGVTMMGTQAYRVDPETNDVEVFDGLNGAYTYSDMTGVSLAGAGGGGAPAG